MIVQSHAKVMYVAEHIPKHMIVVDGWMHNV